MIITRATEYSIRAVLHLAENHPTPVISKQKICEQEGITPAFLTKILQPLIRGGIVRSKRGSGGGFALARDPERLTLLDVMAATEEPMILNVCLLGERACEREPTCPIHELWAEARERIEDVFSKKTVADLARERLRRSAGEHKGPGRKRGEQND